MCVLCAVPCRTLQLLSSFLVVLTQAETHTGFSHSDGGLSHEPENSHSLSEFSGLSERSPLVVQTHANPRVTASPSPLLHDLQQSDSTSYVLLNLAKGKDNKIKRLFCPVLMCDWTSSEWMKRLLDSRLV